MLSLLSAACSLTPWRGTIVTFVVLGLQGCPTHTPRNPPAVREAGSGAASDARSQRDGESKASLAGLAQVTLDLPQVEPYFHVDLKPERSPLIVVGLPAESTTGVLRKFGRPAVIKQAAQVGVDQPAFHFLQIELEAGRARVEFAYPPEGITGRARFRLERDRWEIEDVTISER